MDVIIIFCLVVIMALLSMIASAVMQDARRLSFKEHREERRIEQERRTEQRKRSEAQIRRDAFMREVEDYNGDI